MYILSENGKRLHKSGSLERLISFTVGTNNAVITFNGVIVWVQRPGDFIRG